MVRSIPTERFAQLIAAATATFVAHGYRLTQMAEIAEALGLAKGTLYVYVESKEALFDAAVRYADGRTPAPTRDALPLRTPPAGSTVRYIRKRLHEEVQELELASALGRTKPQDTARAELELIVRDLFRRMARNRRALKLVDRCAPDFPELAAIWFEEGRRGQLALLSNYLARRSEGGHVRPVPNAALAARMLLETVALWAIHLPWDPSPQAFAEREVEDGVVDFVVHAFAKEGRR